MRRIALVAHILLALLLAANPVTAQSKKARSTLKLLTQVDGAGSGLDADTIRGLTPAQLQAAVVGTPGPVGPQGSVGPQGPAGPSNATTLNGLTAQQIVATALAAAIVHIRDNDYFRDATITVTPGLCTCVQASCDGNDFRVNCSGAFLPLPGVQGILTAVGVAPATANTYTLNTCGACGCNASDTNATLGVTAICVGEP